MTKKILRKDCWSCPDSESHETGSQIWLSCKHQDGWRSPNAICNIEGQPVLEAYSNEG